MNKTPRIEHSEIDGTPRGKSTRITNRQVKHNKINRMIKTKKNKIYDQSTDEYCIEECLFNRKDSGQKMIFCDGKCEIWFHLKCLKISDEETERLGKWYCKNCSNGK